MLQETLRALIESKLNDNTYNKRFVVGSYIKSSDGELNYVYNVKNGYKLIETNYIPSMMSFTSSYQAIPEQINGSASISLEFLLHGEIQEDFLDDLSALNEIVEKVIGNYETVEDDGETYRTVWNMEALTPVGVVLINNNYYTQILTRIYVDFSNKNHYGNEYEYYLNGTRIYPYDIQLQRNNEENNPHPLGSYEAKGGNSTSVWAATMTVYVSNFISTIVDTFSSGTYDMERVFEFMEKTPTNSTGSEFPVRIQSAVYKPTLGARVFATITLMKSDTAYTEPTYTITYNLNGGTNDVSNPATFDEDDLPITLADATKTSYTFDGWYDNAGFTGIAKTTITYGENVTLYAKFTFISIKVWTSSSESYWNLQDASNRGTDISATPEVSPTLAVNAFPLGYAMRVSDGSLPATYHYYVAAMTVE